MRRTWIHTSLAAATTQGIGRVKCGTDTPVCAADAWYACESTLCHPEAPGTADDRFAREGAPRNLSPALGAGDWMWSICGRGGGRYKILDIVLVAAFAATKSSTTGPRAKREARIV